MDTFNFCSGVFLSRSVREEILENIFLPYFSTKSVASGSGMGLYFSRVTIEEMMGGKIYASNLDDGLLVNILVPIDEMD